MRALQSFSVRPALPPELSPLERLAMNLRWSWDEPTRDLFRWVDKDAWEAMSHDPVRLLGQVARSRLDQLAADPGFLRYLQEAEDGLNRYLTGPRWFQTRAETQGAAARRLGGAASPLRLDQLTRPSSDLAIRRDPSGQMDTGCVVMRVEAADDQVRKQRLVVEQRVHRARLVCRHPMFWRAGRRPMPAYCELGSW